jgi:hypothetical protein
MQEPNVGSGEILQFIINKEIFPAGDARRLAVRKERGRQSR